MDIKAHQDGLNKLRESADNIDSEWIHNVIHSLFMYKQSFLTSSNEADVAKSYHDSYMSLAKLIPDFDSEVQKLYGSNPLTITEA